MKISEVLNSIPAAPAAGTATPAETAAAPTAETPVDRVTKTDTSGLSSSVAGGMNMAAAERGSRLQALAQQVRSGAYRPSASALADQLLAAAELDARLAKALR